jgi:hypothetical protein
VHQVNWFDVLKDKISAHLTKEIIGEAYFASTKNKPGSPKIFLFLICMERTGSFKNLIALLQLNVANSGNYYKPRVGLI